MQYIILKLLKKLFLSGMMLSYRTANFNKKNGGVKQLIRSNKL